LSCLGNFIVDLLICSDGEQLCQGEFGRNEMFKWVYWFHTQSFKRSVVFLYSFLQCVSTCFFNIFELPEYISVIADEANKICLQEGKKTIAPYYVYEALKVLELYFYFFYCQWINKNIYWCYLNSSHFEQF